MAKKRKSITAAELTAQLEADPVFQAAQKQRNRERAARSLPLRLAEEPIVEDLRAHGIRVSSVWDLVNTDDDYQAAVPVLLKHLPRNYPEPVREGIARALAIPAAI